MLEQKSTRHTFNARFRCYVCHRCGALLQDIARFVGVSDVPMDNQPVFSASHNGMLIREQAAVQRARGRKREQLRVIPYVMPNKRGVAQRHKQELPFR